MAAEWQQRGACLDRAVIALLLGGCAQPATPLSNIDAAGRVPATVDADKLACWQEAEAAHPLTASLLRMRAGLGYRLSELIRLKVDQPSGHHQGSTKH
jgi:hypothetical protein